MLAATLQRLHQDGRLDVTRVAHATGLDPRSLYRWLNGESDPGWRNIALLFRHCGCPEVQAALLETLTAGTPWIATRIDPDMDADGDGDVDFDDAEERNLAAIEGLLRSLRSIRGRRRAPGRAPGRASPPGALGDGGLAELREAGHAAVRAILSSLAILDHIHRRRRPARPLVVRGGA